MPVMARKTTEKTAVGERRGQNGKKGTRDFFPYGKKYHVPFFLSPFSPRIGEGVWRCQRWQIRFRSRGLVNNPG
jgi:hypothetical protein